MGSELSMASRAENTAKYAREYRGAAKKNGSRLLDEVVAVTPLVVAGRPSPPAGGGSQA